jgi:hypothetical protein
MAEMLVRVVDKVNTDDPVLDSKCLKRGMVVAICPDGWPWSDAERGAPYWRIVKVPGAAVGDLSAYLVAELGDPTQNRFLQLRGFKLDLDALALKYPALAIPPADAQVQADGEVLLASTGTTSALPTGGTITDDPAVTLDDALAVKTAVTPYSNPLVL